MLTGLRTEIAHFCSSINHYPSEVLQQLLGKDGLKSFIQEEMGCFFFSVYNKDGENKLQGG